jgi:hypothetical protein
MASAPVPADRTTAAEAEAFADFIVALKRHASTVVMAV